MSSSTKLTRAETKLTAAVFSQMGKLQEADYDEIAKTVGIKYAKNVRSSFNRLFDKVKTAGAAAGPHNKSNDTTNNGGSATKTRSASKASSATKAVSTTKAGSATKTVSTAKAGSATKIGSSTKTRSAIKGGSAIKTRSATKADSAIKFRSATKQSQTKKKVSGRMGSTTKSTTISHNGPETRSQAARNAKGGGQADTTEAGDDNVDAEASEMEGIIFEGQASLNSPYQGGEGYQANINGNELDTIDEQEQYDAEVRGMSVEEWRAWKLANDYDGYYSHAPTPRGYFSDEDA